MSLPYLQLDETQRARIAYLFADAHFGGDPAAYLYELDKRGVVTGRTPIHMEAAGRARQTPPVLVSVIQEVNPTDEMIARARMSMDALAASIAEHLYQLETQEANHE